MKIEDAKLCVNCEEVFSYSDSKDGSCPACGSFVTIFVNRAWIRGTNGPPAAGNKACARDEN